MLRRIFRTLIIFLVVSIGLAVLFFFWGSSGALSEDEKATIFTSPENHLAVVTDTLSVVTYNMGYLSGMTNNKAVDTDLNFFQNNLKALISNVIEVAPDILALQEIDYDSHRSYRMNQYDSLLKYAWFNCGVATVNWDDRYVPFPYWPPRYHFKKVISGQAILSSLPFQSASLKVLQGVVNAPFYYKAFYPERFAHVMIVTLNDSTNLVIINVHLEAFDPETRLIQGGEVLEVYRRFAEEYPVLMVGDFNSPLEEAMNNASDSTVAGMLISENGVSMAMYSHYQENPNRSYTFSSEVPVKKIDYIFYNDRIVMLGAQVLHKFGSISDHLPVFMRFTVR